jgi:hypothetical protein
VSTVGRGILLQSTAFSPLIAIDLGSVHDCADDGSLRCLNFSNPAMAPIVGAPDITACAEGRLQ